MNRIPLLRSTIILATVVTASLLAEESEKKFITIDRKASVRAPGKFVWSDGMTLSAAISAAGGEGWETGLCIIRGADRLGPYRLKQIKRQLMPDPKLLPGDTIT